VSVSGVSTTGPFGQTNTCTTIPAGGSCTISTSFSPTAAGAASGTLAVSSSAPGSPLTVALSGTGTASGTNLALNQPVTASGYTQTYVPANAVDGNTSSYWESTDNAFPQWFQVDLGSAVSISRTFNPSTENTASVTFNAASVWYVKLTFTANTG
jgi:F5/8 type C domain